MTPIPLNLNVIDVLVNLNFEDLQYISGPEIPEVIQLFSCSAQLS